jgi:hypothetical protein
VLSTQPSRLLNKNANKKSSLERARLKNLKCRSIKRNLNSNQGYSMLKTLGCVYVHVCLNRKEQIRIRVENKTGKNDDYECPVELNV